ncbi:MAG: FAD-dependent oxidoreductase [Thermodesulfobacteriota bacterium]
MAPPLVIAGNGIAARAAMAAILARQPAAAIVQLAAEPDFYYRPLLPQLVAGTRTAADLAAVSCPAGPGITRLHDRAVGLDAGARLVRTAASGDIPYQRLLIATGSETVWPAIPGLGATSAVGLRTLADAERLAGLAQAGQRAVVIGGGLVGVKAGLALAARGMMVSIVEVADQLLPRRLDRQAAALVAARLAAAGLSVRTGERVAEVLGEKGVRLASGEVLPATVLVVAAGARPALDWLAGSGLAVEGGIVVDDRLATSLPDVYAAGDVAASRDLVTGRRSTIGLWQAAQAMGQAAGQVMAGGKGRYPGGLAVANATELAGLPVVALGAIDDEPPAGEVLREQHGEVYRKLVLAGDRLVGAVLTGAVERSGLYANLIASGRPVTPFLLPLRRGQLHAGHLLA